MLDQYPLSHFADSSDTSPALREGATPGLMHYSNSISIRSQEEWEDHAPAQGGGASD